MMGRRGVPLDPPYITASRVVISQDCSRQCMVARVLYLACSVHFAEPGAAVSGGYFSSVNSSEMIITAMELGCSTAEKA